MSCVTMPPVPPPVPGPAPPAPAPVPPPPAPGPGTPPGRAQIAVDFSQSYVLANRFCGVVPYMFPDIFAAGGKIAEMGVNMYLKLQNLSPSTAGEVSLGVSADNTRLWISHPLQTVSVAAGGYTFVVVAMAAETVEALGTYVISIDIGSGTPTTFNLGLIAQVGEGECYTPIEGGS